MNKNPSLQGKELSSHFLSLTEIGDLLCLSFPKKLWKIVESDHFKSIRWDENGDCVVIDEEFFQREVLDRKGLIRIFETSSLKSFIRQLNLYGFSKLRINVSSAHSHQGMKKVMIYRNSNFRRDCPFLIQRIKRRVGIRNRAQPNPVSPLPKRKKPRVLRRQFSFREVRMARYRKWVMAKRVKKKVLKKFGHFQKRSLKTYALQARTFENSAGHSRQIQPRVLPRKAPNSTGSSLFIPQEPAASIDPSNMGLLPPSVYQDFTSLNAQITTLMSLCNPWFAMFVAAASSMPVSEPNEQQVSSSAHPCPACNCCNGNEAPSSKTVTTQSPHSSSD
ncbi:heat shock transcription factor, X-linked member 3-like [Monodelphis domestica]|uniref:Heat shock factor protein 3-like n=1 Tax=Monodelphis domestica TaxID=13616 RepID=K7DZ10_MONDO|nr:heat shock transcription factor, X-linked member 3-like [Monodelphis domestica]